MKKILSLVVAMILVFALYSCGGGNAAKVETGNEVQAYIDTVMELDEFKQLIETSEAMGMEMELKAEGNTIVYVYTYTMELDNELAAELLEESLENSEESLQASTDLIKKECPAVESVKYIYMSVDGEYLAGSELFPN